MRLCAAAFCLVQLAGIACLWLGMLVPVNYGFYFWFASLFSLLPGNLMADALVTQLFWHSNVPDVRLAVLLSMLTILFNAIFWTGIAEIVRLSHRLMRSRRAG